MIRFDNWTFAMSLFAISACGGDGAAERSEDPMEGAGADSADTVDTPSVALLTSGPVSDAGWHAGAYEGLQFIGDSLGFRMSHQQTRTPAEFDEAFISYAEAGYGLIFGHGFEYQDAASRVAAQYPDVTFVISSGSRPSANVVPLIFHLNEATYLAGMAAGALTRSGYRGHGGAASKSPRRRAPSSPSRRV